MDCEPKKRPPHLELELDALEHAADVARAAGISEDTAIAGLVRMWRHCWRERVLSVSALAVRGFFGHDATEALQTFGFLGSPIDGLHLVRGAARMLRIEEAKQEARRRGGRAAQGNLKRGAQFPGSAPAAAGGQPGVSRGPSREPAGSQPEVSPGWPPALNYHPPAETKSKASVPAAPAAPSPDTPELLQELWNATAAQALPRWREMPDTRREAARNALKARPLRDGPDSWLAVFQAVSVIPFCLGQNERGWRASPDWTLKPKSAARVLEGAYSSGPGPPRNLLKGITRAEDFDHSNQEVDADGLIQLQI